MSRLIDIEDIAICGWYMEDDEGEVYIKLSDVGKCIDKAPTAYDVEAVVRELETISTFYAHGAEGDKDMGYEYLAIRKYGISDGLDIAIEIVRGGRNERD